MFKIFTFKTLAVISACICFLLIAGAFFNAFSPIIEANLTLSANVPIVMYHQIKDTTSNWGNYILPTHVLKEDFEYFKKAGIIPVSFDDLKDFVENGKALPKKCIVITFDDGEKSFLTKVEPLLEEYSYPANINIVGSLIELYTKNGETDDRYAYLNEDDIKTLSKNPLVEMGCHSYNLHSLSNRRGMGKLYGESDEAYLEFIKRDFEKFNSVVASAINKDLRILAYPYGIRNDTLLGFAKEKGYTITLTCRESVNTLTVGGDLYELGRFNRPYGKSSEDFFGRFYE